MTGTHSTTALLVAVAGPPETGPMTQQLWRRDPNSSGRPSPRTFIRVFAEPGGLEGSVAFYERLLGTECDMRMPYPEKNLALAAVGSFLVIEGTEEALQPFRETTGTLLVDDVEPYLRRLRDGGAEIIHPPVDVPSGRSFTARHPDGTLVEYVHHRPAEHER